VREPSWEHLSQEQLRKIISNYLDEVLRYYQDQQRIELNGLVSEGDHRLEQRASELLGAMNASLDPSERRKAILQVLCRAKQPRDLSLAS